MAFAFENLDSETRRLMLDEIALDEAAGTLFLQAWLSPAGQAVYPDLLRRAAEAFDEEWLRGQLALDGRLRPDASPRSAEILSEGEFNRYYIRALCRRAIAEGQQLIICRAKKPMYPEKSLASWLGKAVDPEAKLQALRQEPFNSHLLKPGAGLSVKLIHRPS